jgi:hypothetical protein
MRVRDCGVRDSWAESCTEPGGPIGGVPDEQFRLGFFLGNQEKY